MDLFILLNAHLHFTMRQKFWTVLFEWSVVALLYGSAKIYSKCSIF